MATQAERRSSTQARLLDAAMDCLVESGYQGFTTTEVVKRAGLSQGALFRYFASKAELLAATTEHLFGALVTQYEARFATLDPHGSDLLTSALDLLWDVFCDPRLLAAFDLYTAARTDPALQTALAPVVKNHGDNLRALGEALLADIARDQPAAFAATVELAVYAMQGLVLNQLAANDPDAPARLLASLKALAASVVITPES